MSATPHSASDPGSLALPPNAVLGALETPRLRLERLALEHAPLLVLLDGDAEVMRYLSGGKPSSTEDVEATIERTLGSRWVAHSREDGAFVGWFALRPVDPTAAGGVFSLGYRLVRAAWGRGLATEGSALLVRLGFERLGAERVVAETMAVNGASRRVMERVGMRHVRTFHLSWDDPIPGTELGEVEYAISRQEWLEGLAP